MRFRFDSLIKKKSLNLIDLRTIDRIHILFGTEVQQFLVII